MQVLKLKEGNLPFIQVLWFSVWKKKKGNHYPTEIGFIITAPLGAEFSPGTKRQQEDPRGKDFSSPVEPQLSKKKKSFPKSQVI